jgi:hypothetical protein
VADIVGIIVFVSIGRRNHDEGVAPAGVIETAAPFVIALLVGWLLGRAWKAPFAVGTGVIIWVTTVALGMVLRKLVFDEGTATAFVIVATVFTGAVSNGWRLAVRTRQARVTTGS